MRNFSFNKIKQKIRQNYECILERENLIYSLQFKIEIYIFCNFRNINQNKNAFQINKFFGSKRTKNKICFLVAEN